MERKMKAVVIHGPGEFAVEHVDIPKPQRGEVLVAVRSIAICGSDPGIIQGKVRMNGWPPYYPFIAGHEFSGEVVSAGEDCVGWKAGDRVSGEAHCGCGICENCRKGAYNLCLNYGRKDMGHRHYGHNTEGCYAQYQVYDQKALTRMPGNVSFDEGTLVDTAGTAYNALRLCGVVPGGYTAVIGPGPMGISAMMIAKAMGSATIMIGRRERLAFAGRLGADILIDYEQVKDPVEEVRRVTGGQGADQVIEAAGNSTAFMEAVQMARKGGHAAFISIPPEDGQMIAGKYLVMNQITLHGTRANPNCSKVILNMISNGALGGLKNMISNVFPIDQTKEAFDTFINRKNGAVKVLIHPFD
ncbi:alcohol dehydrogenase catalytic domain-containing protein [Lachnospiraceae bacterium 54-53]